MDKLKYIKTLIKQVLNRLGSTYKWQDSVKSVSSWRASFVNIGRLLGRGMSPTVSLGIISMLRDFRRIYKSQRVRGLAKYTQACYFYTMRYVAGDALKDSHAFGPAVALSNGLPRIIPKMWRRDIRQGNRVRVRFVLTMFSIYRVLEFPGVKNYLPITSPWKGFLPAGVTTFIPLFWEMLGVRELPQFEWDPIPLLKRGPTSPSEFKTKDMNSRTSQSGTWTALKLLMQTKQCEYLSEYARIVGLQDYWKAFEALHFHACKAEAKAPREDIAPGFRPSLGRLAFKEEPGKIRIIAMVDPITQWFLYPLHKWIFSILRKIPQDATFDQDKGCSYALEVLNRRVKEGRVPHSFSYDLVAATDRLPIVLQLLILDMLKKDLGKNWARILVGRLYVAPGRGPVQYATGQPMGAYSSWAMLALTHHFIVQFSAWDLGYKTWFQDYVILGDDIIIMDEEVAGRYLSVMKQLDVKLSPTKSLRSQMGYLEFAKRFMDLKGSLAPLPLKALIASKHNVSVAIEVLRATGPHRICDALRLLGFGFKVCSSSWIDKLSDSRASYFKLLLRMPGITDQSYKDLGHWLYRDGVNSIKVRDSLLNRIAAYDPPSLIYASWLKLEHLGFPKLSRQGAEYFTDIFYPMFNKLNSQEKERIGCVYNWLHDRVVPDTSEGLKELAEFFLSIPPKNRLLSDEDSWWKYESNESDPCYQIKDMAKILYHPREDYSSLEKFPEFDPSIGLQWRPFPARGSG